MTKPEQILAQELLGREVLDLARGEAAGTIHDFVLDREGRVILLGVLPQAWYEGGRAIAPDSIVSIHHDRVCIESSKALSDFALGKGASSMRAEGLLADKRVLAQNGELLGTLADFAFSLADGRILDVVVLGLDGKRVKVPVAAIRTVGRDYVVIERGGPEGEAAPAEQPAQQEKPAAKSRRKQGQRAGGGSAASPPAPAAEAVSQALFDDAEPKADLSKFDEKKRAFLIDRLAHRDIKTTGGELIVAKGQLLDEAAVKRIVEAGLLGEVFIELTLKK
jgi:uncharacterized protein YrrD